MVAMPTEIQRLTKQSSWALVAQAGIMGLFGAWLLLRALVLDRYSLTDFAVQAGTISVLTCLLILSRLRAMEPHGPDPRGAHDSGPVALRRARLALSVCLLLAAIGLLLWWVVHGSHGFFLKRLQSGLDWTSRAVSMLWAACLLVCPRAAPAESGPQAARLRRFGHVAVLVLIVWTYPYSDPLSLYVQWSGLYLPLVAALGVWNLVARLRGEAFVREWVDFIAEKLVPHDLGLAIPRSPGDTRPSRVWIGLVCVAAMAIVAVNLNWGLPPDVEDRELRPIHPDEKVTHEQAWRLYLDPDPVVFVRGGTLYYRLGLFAKDLATYLTEADHVLRLQILLLRMLNVVAVGGSVLVTYAMGVRIFDWRAALLAAVLMAILPGNVVTAHAARPEAFFTLVCALGLYLVLRSLSSDSPQQWLLLSGVVWGIAQGTKVTALCLAAPIFTALALSRPSSGQFLVRSAQIVLAAGVGYVLSSFETLFFFDRFLTGLRFTGQVQGVQGLGDVLESAVAYLGPVSGYAWTLVGVAWLWVGVLLAVRRRDGLAIVAYLALGHLISFMQRDVTLRSHVHLSPAVSLLVAHLISFGFGSGAKPAWARRSLWFAGTASLLWIAQECLGHVAYLRFGRDARVQAAEWIEANIPPERTIGLTPQFYGDWGSCPPLDEQRRRIVVLPLGGQYDASEYVDRDLDYVVFCDLTLPAALKNRTAAAFLAELEGGERYKLLRTFVPTSDGVHLAEWIGWPMHADWRYSRPTLYLYARSTVSASRQDVR